MYSCIISEIVFRNFYKNTTYPFVFAIIGLYQGCHLLYMFSYTESFYSNLMARFHSCLITGVWWGAVCNFISAILPKENVDTKWWWIIGWVLLSCYMMIQSNAKETAFKQHVDEISDVKVLVLHLEYLMNLVFVQATKNSYELNGYIQYHKKSCLDLSCPLRSENIYKRKNDSISSYEQYTTSKYGEVVNFITHLFNQGLRKYSGHEDLRILYCFYLMEMTKNMQQALEQLALCEADENLALDKLYVVERAKKAIFDDVTSSKDNTTKDLFLTSTQSLRHRVRYLLQNLATQMMDFWSQLLKINPDLAVIISISNAIKTDNDELELLLKDRENGDGIDLDTLRQFASFQETVIMDESRANKIYEVIKARKNQLTTIGIDYGMKISKTDDLSKNSVATVIISGMRDDFCKIVNTNSAAGAVFGYTKNELIGRKVELLMSDVYARIHDQFVSRYISSMEGQMINKERLVVALHKSRYIIPVTVFIKTIEDMGMQTLHFCAFFKTEKHTRSVGYILATEEGDIINISAGVKSVLGIDLVDISSDSNLNKWVNMLLLSSQHFRRRS
jgi:PAS domain S-box-containing protein